MENEEDVEVVSKAIRNKLLQGAVVTPVESISQFTINEYACEVASACDRHGLTPTLAVGFGALHFALGLLKGCGVPHENVDGYINAFREVL